MNILISELPDFIIHHNVECSQLHDYFDLDTNKERIWFIKYESDSEDLDTGLNPFEGHNTSIYEPVGIDEPVSKKIIKPKPKWKPTNKKPKPKSNVEIAQYTMVYTPVSFDGNKIISGNTVYFYDNENIFCNKYKCCLCNEKQEKWIPDYDEINGIKFGVKSSETFCRLCDGCYCIISKYIDDDYLSYKIINKNARVNTPKYWYMDKN